MEEDKEYIDKLGKRGFGVQDIGFKNSYQSKAVSPPGESKHQVKRKPKKKIKTKKTHRKKK